jgi:hypothetical protein
MVNIREPRLRAIKDAAGNGLSWRGYPLFGKSEILTDTFFGCAPLPAANPRGSTTSATIAAVAFAATSLLIGLPFFLTSLHTQRYASSATGLSFPPD